MKGCECRYNHTLKMKQFKEYTALVSKYYHTLKYLELKQTLGRIFARILRQYYLKRKINISDAKGKLNYKVKYLTHDPWNSRNELLKNNFTFLNITKKFEHKINWQEQNISLLWNYHLNYFNYLYLLNKKEKISLCYNWIKSNQNKNSVGWMPYPLSLRIVNWCKENFEDSFIENSLFEQVSLLYHTVEFYHPGNHLLENARALIFGGLYFSRYKQGDKWFKKGMQIFEKEISRQVLDDGSFFELSPMYHSIVLEIYLDIVNIYPAMLNDKTHIDRINKMCDYLISVTHPNGNIVLFNDSSEEIAQPVKDLICYAEELLDVKPKVKFNFENSGTYVYKSKNIYLAIDGGEIGPNNLPAHSHSDIFTYELSIGENKIIVDSGTYNYEADKNREYFRSNIAHNTICIDKVNMAECWDKFRVARRYKPENVSFERNPDGFVFNGEFKGYSKLLGERLCIRRNIRCDETKRIITFNDYVEGKGKHLTESFIHIHPDFKYSVEKNSIKIYNGKVISEIEVNSKFRIESHFYSPKFSVKFQNPVIILYENNDIPVKLNYKIHY